MPYVPAQFKSNLFNCPLCNGYTEQSWHSASTILNSHHPPKHDSRLDGVHICFCKLCGKYTIWVDEKMIYPLINGASLPHEDMPKQVKDIYEEARGIMSYGEPYSPYQTNSYVTNFAYREHFIGALKTKQPYLSHVFKAVTTGEPLAILASPIYAEIKNHHSLVGVQVLGINFSYFNEMIKSIMPTTSKGDKRMVIVDNNGTEIADSSFNNNKLESFKNLQSFQNAKNGQTGLMTEKVNGKNISISYTPIKFAQTNWIALLFSSNN